MTNPYGSPLFAQAASLSNELSAHDERIQRRETDIAEQKARRAQLAERLADLEAKHPSDALADYSDIVEAVAADPSAAVDPDRLAQGVKAQRAAMDVWDTDKAIVSQAVAKLDREIATAEGELAAEKADRNAASTGFFVAAHTALIEQFAIEFEALRAAYLDPAGAIAHVANSNNANIINARVPQIAHGSEMIVSRYDGGQLRNRHLFSPRTLADLRAGSSDHISRLRMALAEGAPAARQ